MANNHIGDYGDTGLFQTLELLKNNDIGYTGAGKNISKAYEPYYLQKDNLKVAVISVCENEFGIETNNTPGSAGYNPRLLMNKIKEEKKNADFVIVVFHGGN